MTETERQTDRQTDTGTERETIMVLSHGLETMESRYSEEREEEEKEEGKRGGDRERQREGIETQKDIDRATEKGWERDLYCCSV